MRRKCIYLSIIMAVTFSLFACGSPSEETTTTSKGVIFPDSNLEAAVRKATNKPQGPIYTSRLEKLTSLSLSRRNITDLTGLEYCVNLGKLELDGNPITDISLLASLPDLTQVVLEHDQIRDLSPLVSLTIIWAYIFPDSNLETVVREAINKPEGSIYISELEKLTFLSLAEKNVTDFTGLELCINLERLELHGNQIEDISFLDSLTALTEVVLEPGQIEDLSSLTSRTDLNIIWAATFLDPNLEVAIREVIDSPVGPIYTSELESLTTLSLAEANITDLTGLEHCINLERLEIYDSRLRDVSSLASLTNLTRLYLNRSEIRDMSPLDTLTDLTIIRAVEFPDENLELAIREAIYSYEYSDEPSFEAKAITNEQYGFSLKHPSDWTDTTATALYEARAPSEVTGLFVAAWWSGAQGSTLANVLSVVFAEASVEILASGDTTLADGTPATVVEYNFAPGDWPMHCYSIGVIRQNTWVVVSIWNTDQYATYDRALFREIARTLHLAGPMAGPIYTLDLEDLTSLSASGREITDIAGLQYCINLEKLDVSDNQIRFVSPLASLTNLTHLNLNDNQIADISSLDSLTNLTELRLDDNWITDVSPLAHLTNLTWLYLHGNQVRDISRLNSLDNLIELWLDDNWITDVSPLASLTNLTRLHLHSNRIEDVSSLASLTNLTWLSLHNNQIEDISPLASLNNLTVLLLEPNYITDVSPLAALTDLVVLWGVTFPDPTLEAIIREAIGRPEGPIYTVELQGLTSLSLTVRDIIEPAGEDTTGPAGEDTTDLIEGDITDLTGLEYCVNLKSLDISDTQVEDISPLASLTNLTRLYLHNNRISDISPLASLTNLTRLYLDNNQIEDISPLSSLTSLTVLWLHDNQISDIAPLVANSGLSQPDTINLMNNPLSNVSVSVHIPELKERGVMISH